MIETAELEQMAPTDYRTPGALPVGTWILWDDGTREGIGQVLTYKCSEPDNYVVIIGRVMDTTYRLPLVKMHLMLEHIERPVRTAEDLMPWLTAEKPGVRKVALIAAREVG